MRSAPQSDQAQSGPVRPATGIVHLGPGAFFRAFCAIYTAEAMTATGGDWGIVGVSLRSASVRDALEPQKWRYTAVELAPDKRRCQTVEVLNKVLVAPEDPGAVLRLMADPTIKIVSLTITEKGYCHDTAQGALDCQDPGIVHDLGNPHMPRTAIGYLVRALDLRRQAGLRPFTVLSCDNLPENGGLLRSVVLAFARLSDPELADWIGAEGRFPSTMVDRITPATTQKDIEDVAARIDWADAAPVLHEPFRQWVIEDNFVDGQRPAWDAAGAEFVTDVGAHETMKLRCLNGTHSSLAYLGYLAGYDTIAQTISDPRFRQLITEMWQQEILPGLTPPEGVDLAAYTKALLARYDNPSIEHRTWQIAMDGSQKLPQRLLSSIEECLACDLPITRLCLAVAGWMRYVAGFDEDQAPIDVRDPMADALARIWDGDCDAGRIVEEFLAISAIFPNALAQAPRFRSEVTERLASLLTQGVRASVKEMTDA